MPCRSAPTELGKPKDVRSEEGARRAGPRGPGCGDRGAKWRVPSGQGGGGAASPNGVGPASGAKRLLGTPSGSVRRTPGAAGAPGSAAGVLPGCSAPRQGCWHTGSLDAGARRRCEIPRSARPGKGVQPGAPVREGALVGQWGATCASPPPSPGGPPDPDWEWMEGARSRWFGHWGRGGGEGPLVPLAKAVAPGRAWASGLGGGGRCWALQVRAGSTGAFLGVVAKRSATQRRVL